MSITNHFCQSLSSGYYSLLNITKSEARSWHDQDNLDTFRKDNAYDGDYFTFYSVPDNDTDGNFLRLYLSEKSRIYEVKITSRLDCCAERIVNTTVKVYSDGVEVEDCGTIDG